MRTSRSILAVAAAIATAVGCAKAESVPNPYASYGGNGGSGTAGAAGSGTGGSSGTSVGGTDAGNGGAGNAAGTAGAGGSVGGTDAGNGGAGNAAGTAGAGGSVGGAGGAGGSTGGAGGSTGGAGGSTGGAGGSTGGSGGSAGGTGGSTGGSGGTGGTGSCTPPVPGGACDTSPQCGCASGQACVVVNATTGATGCVAPGTVGPAQACSGTDCIAGYDCVGGACKKYCDTAADCGSGQDCIQVTSGGTNIPGMKVCSTGCNLVDPGAVCGSGLTCYQVSQTSSATDCGQAGTGTGANGCSSSDPTTCAPGYLCVYDSSNNYSCAHWCRVGMSGDCTIGTCSNLQTPVVINNVTYGICQ